MVASMSNAAQVFKAVAGGRMYWNDEHADRGAIPSIRDRLMRALESSSLDSLSQETSQQPHGELADQSPGLGADGSFYLLVAGWSSGGLENDEFDFLSASCGEEEIKQKLAGSIEGEKQSRALRCRWASDYALGETIASILARPSGISVWAVWVAAEGDFTANLRAAARRALGETKLKIKCEDGLDLAAAARRVVRFAARARSRRDDASNRSLPARRIL